MVGGLAGWDGMQSHFHVEPNSSVEVVIVLGCSLGFDNICFFVSYSKIFCISSCDYISTPCIGLGLF